MVLCAQLSEWLKWLKIVCMASISVMNNVRGHFIAHFALHY